MQRAQIFELINSAYKQTVGTEGIIEDNLQSVIDGGNAVLDLDNGKEIFTKSLIDQIGRIKIMSKSYKGRYPKMLREAWEYGSILMTVRQTKLPKANVNESWQLEDGVSYDPNITTLPENIEVKFFNKRVTFEIPYTIVNYQLKEAFQGPDQLAAFVGMLVTNVNNAMDVAIGNLARRTLNNFIAKVLYDEYANDDYGAKSGVMAVNLLYKYNQTVSTPITAAEALKDPDFLKFAAKEISMTNDHMKELSVVFNLAGNETFAGETNTVYLDEFKKSMGVYLYNAPSQFAKDFISLPEGEEVSYWQGEGEDGFDFDDTSKIHVTDDAGHETECAGILAVTYDNDACVIACTDRHTTSNYNARAEFTNFWDKATMGCFNDFGKCFVVYFIADDEE